MLGLLGIAAVNLTFPPAITMLMLTLTPNSSGAGVKTLNRFYSDPK